MCADLRVAMQVIKKVRGTLKYFKKSTFATSHLVICRKQFGVKRGLVSVGKTRFGTMYHAGESIRRNLKPIRQLCSEKLIHITVCPVSIMLRSLASAFFVLSLEFTKLMLQKFNDNFMDGRFTATLFEGELSRLLSVLAPIAKAITCLESTHSTVSDVYIFWLAVAATIHQIIVENVDKLPIPVLEEIRKAVNFRFNQMINDGPDDVYLTGFILDPRKLIFILIWYRY